MSGINLLVRLVISAGLLIVVLGQTEINANAAHSVESVSICTSPIKVMPLGDSITTGKYSGTNILDPAGAGDDIGYRMDLWELLTGAGYSVDFVGSQENGDSDPINFSDPQHEGHNGQTDAYIAENIYNNGGENWLSQNPPDVILLHIGTNSLDDDPSDVEDILDEIDEYEIDTARPVTVFVARIIDKVPNDPLINQFNDNVEAMIQGRADFGAELFMVDMEDGAGIIYDYYTDDPPGDMFDNLHPYETGYNKMANAWMTAFDDICAHRPTLNYLFDRFSIEGSGVGVKINATDPDDDPLTYSAQGLPAGLSINPSSGWITGATQDGATLSSPYEVTVRVRDVGGLADQGTFNWYVELTGSIYLPIAIR